MSAPISDAGRDHLAAALRLGRRGLGETWPNPSVGAILVRDGYVVSRARTAPGGRPHAEVLAIEAAGSLAQGATVYVSLEPCAHHGRTPPCAEALIAAGIADVVTAGADPDPRVSGKGHARLAEAGLRVAASQAPFEARLAHAGHMTRVLRGRPFVTLKLAVSADDGIGLRGEGQVALTSAIARRHVHALRARFDAILVGSGTFLADAPRLDCRLPGLEHRSPVRVVLDRSGRVPSEAVGTDIASPRWILSDEDVPGALRSLAKRGITRLFVEGGARIARAFLEADAVDEALLFRSPRVLGDARVPALVGLPLARIEDDPGFIAVERLWFGDLPMVRYLRAPGGKKRF